MSNGLPLLIPKWIVEKLKKWGNTDISSIGDGTVTGAISTVSTTATNASSGISTINQDVPWYGTCSTAANTTAKVATTTDTKLTTLAAGQKVRIKFTYTNTATTPTLNVDSKGAKTIYAYGTTKPTIWWNAGDVVDFTYDGTYWIMGSTCGQINTLNQALDTASNKITALEASELFETRIAINCNTSVSGITPFGYKGTSLPISSDTTSKIYSVTIEKPSSGEWVFSVDVNQTDRTVTVYANGSTTVYADIAYHHTV